MGFFKPSPRFAAFSISVISLAPFVTSHAALFSRFANIGSGLYFLPIKVLMSFTRSSFPWNLQSRGKNLLQILL